MESTNKLRFNVPAPIMNTSEGKKFRLWRLEVAPRQFGEIALLIPLLLLANLPLGLLDWLPFGGQLHILLLLALVIAAYVYVFVPLNGRTGTAWLWLTVRWRVQGWKHEAVVASDSPPLLTEVYIYSPGELEGETA